MRKTSVQCDVIPDYWVLDMVARSDGGWLPERRLMVPNPKQWEDLFRRRNLLYPRGKDISLVNVSASDIYAAKSRLIKDEKLERFHDGTLKITVAGLNFLESSPDAMRF